MPQAVIGAVSLRDRMKGQVTYDRRAVTGGRGPALPEKPGQLQAGSAIRRSAERPAGDGGGRGA